MTRYRNTVVGSYPRPTQAADTMKKPTLTQADTDEMVRWAAKDQGDLGLDVITDGEAYRENMYYFYQKRVDGVTFEDMPRLTFGDAGFGIECPRVIGNREPALPSSPITGSLRATPRRLACGSSRPLPDRMC